MEPSIPKKRWRPRLRFSLRTLMIAMTLVCAFLGYRVHRAHEQRTVVRALELAGAQVRYDWQHHSAGPTNGKERQPAGPQWLRKLIGDEYFQEVLAVHWRADLGLKSDNLAHLAKLPQLRNLVLWAWPNQGQLGTLPVMPELEELQLNGGCDATDATLAQISRQPSLKSLTLQLQAESLTSGGLEHLARLSKLESLDLSASTLNDPLMAAVGRLHSLKKLRLDYTNVSDSGLRHLNQLQELREFSAFWSSPASRLTPGNTSRLTDAAYEILANHEKLTSIGISICPSPAGSLPVRHANEGLAALADLPITYLCVSHDSLHDEDLVTLATFPRLVFLTTSQGKFSPQAIASFKKTARTARVHHD